MFLLEIRWQMKPRYIVEKKVTSEENSGSLRINVTQKSLKHVFEIPASRMISQKLIYPCISHTSKISLTCEDKKGSPTIELPKQSATIAIATLVTFSESYRFSFASHICQSQQEGAIWKGPDIQFLL